MVLIIVKMHRTLIIILVKLFVLMLMALFQKIILTLIHKMLYQKFSYGHRNQQGIAYDSKNDILYSNEHGPRGGDELNLIIIAGKELWLASNYLRYRL